METKAFIADAQQCFTETEREALIEHVAAYPAAGDLIRETGGVRKPRWGAGGRGKRGGARVIYFFHSEQVPLFLLAAYAKSRKSDLSAAERSAMRRLTAEIVAEYRRRPPQRRTRMK